MQADSLNNQFEKLEDYCSTGLVKQLSRCLVSRNHGALYHDLRRDELWGRFFTAAPQGLRRSVERTPSSKSRLS
jgi:hypothetical protein